MIAFNRDHPSTEPCMALKRRAQLLHPRICPARYHHYLRSIHLSESYAAIEDSTSAAAAVKGSIWTSGTPSGQDHLGTALCDQSWKSRFADKTPWLRYCCWSPSVEGFS